MEQEETRPEEPVNEVAASPTINPEIAFVGEMADKVRTELGTVIVGQQKLMDLLLIGLFTRSHVLLEGVPGIAKTMTAALFAKTMDAGFSRIQFTPDLMPSDVIGTNVFNQKTAEFDFKEGPVFSNIVLVDEINRAPAKTQAALFEVMQEKQVSIDGTTYKMDDVYQIIATQNPIDQEGTYKLPEAQLDRFIFKVNLTYPSLEEEIDILNRFESDFEAQKTQEIKAVLNSKSIQRIRETIEKISIEPQLISYIAQIVDATRNDGDIYLGASPRASLSIMKASKAAAALAGRDYVTPDDIRDVTFDVLNHRIILSPEREIEGVPSVDIINRIVNSIEVPR